MKTYLFLTILVLTNLAIDAFIAYDCNSANLNITAFSTLEVAACSIPELPQPRIIPYGKLLQRKENIQIPYQSCFVLLSFFISKCSSFHDMQAVQEGYFDHLDILGPEKCRSMHSQRTYAPNTPYMVTSLTPNTTMRYDRTIAGNLRPNGKCEGGKFYFGTRSWDDVVVQAKIKIILNDGVMVGSTKDNRVIHPSGARFALKEGYGIEQLAGDIVWDANKMIECEIGEYDVLYSGPMSLLKYHNPTTLEEDRDIYIVKNEEVLFALRTEKMTTACGYPALRTEHPRLYIVTDQYAIMRFTQSGVDPVNMDMTAYINNKLMFLDISSRSNMETMYKNLIQQQCELERDQIKTKLGLAHTDLQEFAYRMGEGPGFSALVSGEVVYLLRCTPVNVELRSSEYCFQELQVSYNNQSLYMAPKTHILQHYGSQIACNRLLPVTYKLSSEWFSVSPEISSAKSPQILAPHTKWSWSYESTDVLMRAGIYSPSMMDELQRHLLFPHEVQSATTSLIRESMGYTTYDQGLRFRTVMDEISLGNMVEKKLNQMWGWFTTFGSITSGFLGLFILVKLIIVALNTGLNFNLLYKTFGTSLHLCAALFTGLTHFLIHKHNQSDDLNKPGCNPQVRPSQESSQDTPETIKLIEFKNDSYKSNSLHIKPAKTIYPPISPLPDDGPLLFHESRMHRPQ